MNELALTLKKRVVYIDLDLVVDLAGRIDVSTAEVFKVFDYDSYEKFFVQKKNNGKPYSNTKESLRTTLNQFYTGYAEYNDPNDKRKVLFSFEDLHNPDATPIARLEKEGGRPVTDLSLHLEALILIGLKAGLLDKEDRTFNKWLIYFGLVSSSQYNHYNEFMHKNTNKYIEYIENDKVLPTSIDYKGEGSEVMNLDMTKKQIGFALTGYYNSLTTLTNRFKTILMKLQTAKMIEVDSSYKYGVEEVIIADPTQEECRHFVKRLLSPQEKARLIELESDIRDALQKQNKTNKEIYRDNLLKNRMLSYIKNVGIDFDPHIEPNKYLYTYDTCTIAKNFTDKELQAYLNKNEKLKEIYEDALQNIISKYNILRLEHLTEWFNKKYIKACESIEANVEKKYKKEIYKGDLEKRNRNKEAEIERGKENSLYFKEAAIKLSHSLLTEKHTETKTGIHTLNTEPILQHLTFE